MIIETDMLKLSSVQC